MVALAWPSYLPVSEPCWFFGSVSVLFLFRVYFHIYSSPYSIQVSAKISPFEVTWVVLISVISTVRSIRVALSKAIFTLEGNISRTWARE